MTAVCGVRTLMPPEGGSSTVLIVDPEPPSLCHHQAGLRLGRYGPNRDSYPLPGLTVSTKSGAVAETAALPAPD